jgi:hypothetical protein
VSRAPFLLSLLLVPVLSAQNPVRTLYIPALAYGPDVWSIVRLTNTGSTPQTARLEVYRENGTALPIGPAYDLQPGATLDVRIDAKTEDAEMCWARVILPDNVRVRGFVEILEGNALEDFPRAPHQVSDLPRWVTLSDRIQGKQMYFLNAADRPTVVAFCAARQATADACQKKGTPSARFRVGPRQSISVQVRKLRGRFFITESSAPEAAVLVLFDNGPGIRKTFGSNSSIEFGDALP